MKKKIGMGKEKECFFLQPHSNKCITSKLLGPLPNVLCSRDACISLAGTYPELHSSTGDHKEHHLLVKMKKNMCWNSPGKTQNCTMELACLRKRF